MGLFPNKIGCIGNEADCSGNEPCESTPLWGSKYPEAYNGGSCSSSCSTKIVSSDNVSYVGPNLPCTGINTCTSLTIVIQKIDEIICELIEASGRTIPTNTSQLINDGEDGVNPFITAADVNTPNLQEVTDENNITSNNLIVSEVFGLGSSTIYGKDSINSTGVFIPGGYFLNKDGLLLSDKDGNGTDYLISYLKDRIILNPNSIPNPRGVFKFPDLGNNTTEETFATREWVEPQLHDPVSIVHPKGGASITEDQELSIDLNNLKDIERIYKNPSIVSSNGKNWFIAYGNKTYVIAASGNVIKYSKDKGVTWADSLSPSSSYQNVQFLNGIFIATRTGSNPILISTDGITWETRSTSTTGGYLFHMAYGNGTYLISNFLESTATIKSYYSTDDGDTWTAVDTEINAVRSCMYGNGVFVLVGSNRTAVSSDAINWDYYSVANVSNNYGGVFADGKFVVTRNTSNKIAHSIDGETWFEEDIPNGFTARTIAYGDGIYLIYINTTKVLISEDLVNWEEIDIIPENSMSTESASIDIVFNNDDGIFASSTVTSQLRPVKLIKSMRINHLKLDNKGVYTHEEIDEYINNGVKRIKVTITPAQMLDLVANPVELIPAPGAGRVVNIHSVAVFLDYNSVAYNFSSTPTDRPALTYSSLAASEQIMNLLHVDINSTEDLYFIARPSSTSTFGKVNEGVFLKAGVDATQGNSPVTFILTYTIDDFN